MRLAFAVAFAAFAAPLAAQAPRERVEPTPQPRTTGGAIVNQVPMTDAERAFAETLTGAALTGRFTVDGQTDAPKEERYEIAAATKAGPEDWVIVARIKYGPNDVRVPVPVKVHWAGDTPVLSLTDLTIPGMGTFTSRVMFYGDRYAGTWQHGEKGGHLFGSIGRGDAAAEPAGTPAVPPAGSPATPR